MKALETQQLDGAGRHGADSEPEFFDPIIEGPVPPNPLDSVEVRLDGSSSEEIIAARVDRDDDDIEAVSVPCCRICLKNGAAPGDELISPCLCVGTQQFVHRSCLDHWRLVMGQFAFAHCTTCKAQFHLRVEQLENNAWRWIKRGIIIVLREMLLFTAIVCAINIVIFTLGYFAYVMDQNQIFRNLFKASSDHDLSEDDILFKTYFCVGIVLFEALLGFFIVILYMVGYYYRSPKPDSYSYYMGLWIRYTPLGFLFAIIQIIAFTIFGFDGVSLGFTPIIVMIPNMRLRFLRKKKFAKEFVVEDLQGCYTPLNPNPKHKARLDHIIQMYF